jgi:hypothetical protein
MNEVDTEVAVKEAERNGYERGYEEAAGKSQPIRRSVSTKNFDIIMLAIMQKMGSASKDSKNPYFSSTYADLNSVRETIRLAMFDAVEFLLVQQFPVTDYSKCMSKRQVIKNKQGDYIKDIEISVPCLTVTTRLTDPKSGEWQESDLSCYPAEDTPQSIGSAITYLRRYSLMPLFNIAPADDDGNAGSGRDPMNQDPHGQPPKVQGAPRTTRPAAAMPVTTAKAPEAPKQLAPPTKPTGPRPLTDAERKHLGLIDGQQFDSLKELCKKKGVDPKKWKIWLTVTYGITTMVEIKASEYSGVVDVVTTHPEKIMNVKEPTPREPGADPEEPLPQGGAV